jgi:hypothetical protein
MGRKKLDKPRLIGSVYMDKSLWDKAEELGNSSEFKSKNEVLVLAIIEYFSNRNKQAE